MGCLLGPIFGIIRTILTIIGLITVIVGVVIGLLVWQLTKPPGMVDDMRPVEVTSEAADRFDSKWEAFIAQIPGVNAILEFTEDEVSSKAMEAVDELGIPLDVETVMVNFEPGSVKVSLYIKGKILGLTLHLAAVGEVELREEGGRTVLWYRIDDLSLPSQVKDFIEDKIEGALDIDNLKEGTYELPEDLEVDLMDIEVVEEGGEYILRISGLVLE